MPRQQRYEGEPQRRGPADSRPRELPPFLTRLGTIALYRFPTALQAQGEAGEDVGGDGEANKEGLEERGLVVGPGEEEVGI